MSTPTNSPTFPAFVLGFPLVFNLDQVRRYVEEGVGANPAAPFNSFSHARTLAGPDDTFVSINNDTVYSMAQLDLSAGPVILQVPDTAGRYYVLQFVDAWTNNYAYVGHRATGTSAGTYVVVPPGHESTEGFPTEATVIKSPTAITSIVGRWACDGDDDLPAVHALQDATTLTPLNPRANGNGLPAPDPAVPQEIIFLEKFRLWSQAFPPAPSDLALLEQLAPLGITQAGPSPYVDLTSEQVAQLGQSLKSDLATLTDTLRQGAVPKQNGWQLTYHAFDYNIDFFEVGTINEPLYTSMPEAQRHFLRAAAALGGLWGNHSYEAAYAPVYEDSNGEPLTGSREYTLTLNPPPPVSAFWSITMYAMPDFYLVHNPINRYSIGDRTPGLVYNEDGSLTIAFSNTEPTDPTLRANWLPTPEGDFRPLLRMYEPDPSIITGGYEIPPVVRTS